MRATISFETDVDQVEGAMAVLAASEEHNLRAAADLLSNFTVLDGSVLDAITEALRLLDSSVGQLRQYQQMMVSFERAKFETILPQPTSEGSQPNTPPPSDNLERLQGQSKDMAAFNRFLGDINASSRDSEFMNLDESPPPKKEE
jgi:hypothetical protein